MSLYVARSGLHGLGVFAGVALAAGDVIEECPILVIPPEQRELMDQTRFAGYYYEWDEGAGALALGFGSLYNHSYRPNARYDPADEGPFLVISSIRAIRPGDEITINYNGSPRSRKPVWFEPLEPAPRETEPRHR